MNAVIYARYSSESQREESIEGQVRECREFAEKAGFTIIDIYIDRALSAKTDNRPAFQEMIRDSSRKNFEAVIVWKLDRFSRNRYDSARYKAALKKNGVKVISAVEKISEGAEGIILESVLEGFAEYYSAELAEKVSRGMTENVLKGKYNGGTLAVGYKVNSDNEFVIDEQVAPLIVKAFQMCADGEPVKEIAEYLNHYGVKSSRGTPMNMNSVRNMIRNRRYLGENRFHDTVGSIPAIITEKLFDRAQTVMDGRVHKGARGQAKEEYLLTTKLMCGECGAMMRGESGTGRGGQIYRYYKCASIKDRKADCSQVTVKKDLIEDAVIEELIKIISDDKTVEAIADAAVQYQETHIDSGLELLREQEKDVRFRLGNLIGNLELGITNESVVKRISELEEQEKDIKRKIKEEEKANPVLTKDQVMTFLRSVKPTDISDIRQRRKLINSLLNRAILKGTKLTLYFNYRAKTKEVSVRELLDSKKEPILPPQVLARTLSLWQSFPVRTLFLWKGRTDGFRL